MLFTPCLCDKIFSGLKIQARRVKLPGQVAETDEQGNILRVYQRTSSGKLRLKWEVGRTYAVQPGRGKPSRGRILLNRIRREQVQDITVEDIQSEGIEPGDENWFREDAAKWIYRHDDYAYYKIFKFIWNSLNQARGYGWDRNPSVWVLCFQAVEHKEKNHEKKIQRKTFDDPEEQKLVDWMVMYLIEESFSKRHLNALVKIIGLFNECEESETEIFEFSQKLFERYAA